MVGGVKGQQCLDEQCPRNNVSDERCPGPTHSQLVTCLIVLCGHLPHVVDGLSSSVSIYKLRSDTLWLSSYSRLVVTKTDFKHYLVVTFCECKRIVVVAWTTGLFDLRTKCLSHRRLQLNLRSDDGRGQTIGAARTKDSHTQATAQTKHATL